MSPLEPHPSSDWLASASVPVVPPAVGFLLSTVDDPRRNIKSVAADVERFPSIAARLLAVANSAWSSPLSAVTRLPDACARLGLNLVRALSVALAVANTFDPSKCRGFDSERYWVSALLAAEGATLLANGMGQIDAALTWRSVALFHNMGLLWLADHRPQATAAALARDTEEGVVSTMQDMMGTDFCHAGALLVRAWGLPEVYPSVIAYQRDPDSAGRHFLAAATVGVAADMASTICRGDAWTADRVPANVAPHLGADLTQSTHQSLTAALQDVRAMGRAIATM
ncbi:MAG: HDOD domain-containing protein [Luteimonas sp.]|nr:HDOD domain-containing protein [Luteimonas sp.]